MKKLFTAAVLAVMALTASAEVSVFGTMDAGYTATKAPGATTSTTSFQSGGMTTSFVGFKGSEDLGNGSKAVYELSSFLSDGTGATLGGTTVNTFARSAFAGVAGSFGQVTMGRQSNPSFLPTILFNAYGDSGSYSPLWHATYFGNTGNTTTQLYNDTAWDNSVAYSTPSIGGAVVTVQNAKGTGAQNGGANVLFFKGDLGLTAYTQTTGLNSSGSFQTNAFAGGGTAKASGAGASYDLKVAKVFATYQTANDNTTNQSGKTTQYSALVPFGPGSIMAEYAHSKTTNAAVVAKYNEYAVGYDYAMSKKTDVYATFGRTDVTNQTAGQTIGAGLRVRF